MKILLIGNYEPDAIISMERFLTMLATTLPTFGHQVRIIRPKPKFGNFQATLKSIGKWLGYIDQIFLFPLELHQALSWADVVHICDHGNAIYTQYLQHIPHVVTCHDLLAIRAGLGEFTEYKTGWTGKQLQKMIIKGLNQAQSVVCVSKQTQRDLLRLSSIKPDAVSVIYQGFNYAYSPMESYKVKKYLQALGIPQNCHYILHVGANHWYKNRLGVISIFKQLLYIYKNCKLHLIMVGKPFTSEINKYIKNYHLSQNVIELINVDSEYLRALYSGAVALLFPSLQEGFGWPIIEAQACGCPVFTSNRPPMNEIGGQAAIYIDPAYPQQVADQIIFHLPKRKEIIDRGLINAQRFKTENIILEYIKIYQKLKT